MQDAEQVKGRYRVGVVATDELRIAGFRQILEDDVLASNEWEVVLLDDPHILETAGLSLVVIDADACEHLLQLVTTFRTMRPTLRLIVLGGQDDPAFIEDAIAAGARGVLSHEVSAASLRQALQVVLDGSVWAPRKILARLLDRASEAPPSIATIHLTRKELDVLKLLVLGLSNREIAHALGVEPATVKGHLGRLMRKATVRSRTALTLRAIEQRWA